MMRQQLVPTVNLSRRSDMQVGREAESVASKPKFFANGREICRRCFVVVAPVGKGKLKEIIQSLSDENGALKLANKKHGNLGMRYDTFWRPKVRAWQANFFGSVAEPVPNSSSNEKHLAAAYSWKMIWKTCREELMASNPEAKKGFGMDLFREVRDEHHGTVRLPNKTRLGKCETCIAIRRERRGIKGTSAAAMHARALNTQRMTDHEKLFRGERDRMHDRMEAVQRSNGLLGGMSTDAPTPYLVPHVRDVPKSWFRLAKFPLQVQAYADDGVVPRRRTFVMCFQRWSSDANFVGTQTFHMLKKMASKPHRPRIIYIQSDNCVRENKNRYVDR